MWRLRKEFRFEASHQLPFHDGKCARLHGHSWVGEAMLESDKLIQEGAKLGMVIDYGDISAALHPIVEQMLDHHHLNDSLQLESPTSEEIARFIYDILKPRLPLLQAIIIHETCTSQCEYRPLQDSKR